MATGTRPTLPAVGDRIPSALDSAYANYSAWCRRLGYPASSYQDWLTAERKASGIAMASIQISHAESRRRAAALEGNATPTPALTL